MPRTSKIGQLQSVERSAGALRSNMRRWFANKAQRKLLSKVHDISHIEAVSSHARVLAEELANRQGIRGMEAKRIAALAGVAGTAHDIVRRATELKPHGTVGKQIFLRLVKKYPNFLELNPQEISIVAEAIELHELPYEELTAKVASRSPEERIVLQAVQIADKVFEASGFRVLERRSFFVGKERLAKGKDLEYLKQQYGEKAPLYAVAMESCMRLRGINYLPDVEKALQPIAEPLHGVQERFYLGLLKELGFKSEMELLSEMRRIKFPKVDKMGEKLERAIRAESARVSTIPISADTARSAAETVMHFANSRSPEEAIATFSPRGNQAKKWLAGIKNYRSPSSTYLRRLQLQVRKALKKT